MKMFVTANEETPQMFKNRILNAMTLVHWTVPLILYIPVAGFLFYRVVPKMTSHKGEETP